MSSKLLTVMASAMLFSLAWAADKPAVANANLVGNPYLEKLAHKGGETKLAPRAASSATANASISYIGDSSKTDGRVRKALDSASVKYTIDDDGDFKVSWSLEGNRSHVTFINSNVHEKTGIREVWAVAFTAKSIDAGNLQALLELNATYSMGAWEVQKKRNGEYWAVFSVKVPADASGATLKLVSSLVAAVADEVEAKATHGDKL